MVNAAPFLAGSLWVVVVPRSLSGYRRSCPLRGARFRGFLLRHNDRVAGGHCRGVGLVLSCLCKLGMIYNIKRILLKYHESVPDLCEFPGLRS